MDTLLAIDCPRCGRQFDPVNGQQRYCSRQCQRSTEKSRARARVPKKLCASCGDDKPSRKGDYCGKPDCTKRSARDSLARYADKYPDRVKANWQRQSKKRVARERERLLAERGPKPNCVVCDAELRWWGASYCSGVECQREKKRQENRAYYEANQDAHRSRISQYRARKAGTTVEPVSVVAIYERDRWRCGLCSKRIDQALSYPHPMSRSIDHIVPLSCGGTHTAGNLQAAHLRCNVAKGNRGGGEQLALL